MKRRNFWEIMVRLGSGIWLLGRLCSFQSFASLIFFMNSEEGEAIRKRERWNLEIGNLEGSFLVGYINL